MGTLILGNDEADVIGEINTISAPRGDACEDSSAVAIASPMFGPSKYHCRECGEEQAVTYFATARPCECGAPADRMVDYAAKQ